MINEVAASVFNRYKQTGEYEEPFDDWWEDNYPKSIYISPGFRDPTSEELVKIKRKVKGFIEKEN